MQSLLGAILGVLIASIAYKLKALSVSGAIAASVVGGVIFAFGGLSWAILLLVFFISSSGLSFFARERKASLSEKFAKGSQRDWAQVLSNSGIGLGLVILHQIHPEILWVWMAYAGALAAVNADTWGTEIGILAKQSPRLITGGQPVEPGTSGAISWVGSLGSFSGGLLMGASAWLVHLDLTESWIILVITISGLLGSMVDSLLGASIQGLYFCPICQKETEKHPLHTCGASTRYMRGFRWMNNDLVNLICSLTGAIFAGVSFWLSG